MKVPGADKLSMSRYITESLTQLTAAIVDFIMRYVLSFPSPLMLRLRD
jgi:hypothetical protein